MGILFSWHSTKLTEGPFRAQFHYLKLPHLQRWIPNASVRMVEHFQNASRYAFAVDKSLIMINLDQSKV